MKNMSVEDILFDLRKSDRWFLSLILLGLLMYCLFLWGFSTIPESILMPVTVMMFLSTVPIIDILRRNKGVIINPAFAFSTTFLVLYGFSALNSYKSTYAGIDMTSAMPKALWYACAGLGLFLFGYYSPIGANLASYLPSFPKQVSTQGLQIFFWSAFFIALIRYSSYFIGIGGFTSFLEGFDMLAVATITILTFGKDRIKRGIGSQIWHFPLVILLSIFPALLSGFRGLLILPFIISGVTIYLIRKQFPWKSVIAIFLIAYLVIIPVSNPYKQARQGKGLTISESIDYTVKELGKKDFSESVSDSTSGTNSRYAILPVFTVIIERAGQTVAYVNGLTYFNFILAFIPRFFWQDKPVLNNFSNYLARAYGLLDSNDYITSIGLGFMGETWINFGEIGLLIMGLYGLFFKLVFKWILTKSYFSEIACAVYMPVIWSLTNQENVLVNNIGGLLKFTFIALMVTKIIPKDKSL